MTDNDVPRIALILAGGKGVRLRPITYRIPKPLVQINDKPVIDHIIEEARRNGIHEFVISVGYKANLIIKHLKKYSNKNPGIKISYLKENPNTPLGTGGAIKFAFRAIRRRYNGDVLILNGDDLFTLDIAGMYLLHRKEKAMITVNIKEAKRRSDVANSGVVALRGNRITKFVEKPALKEAPSKLINMGKYIVNTEVYKYFPRRKVFFFEKEFLQGVVGKIKVCGYVSDGLWYPTDNPERLMRARTGWIRNGF